jgi:hypothetical protein
MNISFTDMMSRCADAQCQPTMTQLMQLLENGIKSKSLRLPTRNQAALKVVPQPSADVPEVPSPPPRLHITLCTPPTAAGAALRTGEASQSKEWDPRLGYGRGYRNVRYVAAQRLRVPQECSPTLGEFQAWCNM